MAADRLRQAANRNC